VEVTDETELVPPEEKAVDVEVDPPVRRAALHHPL
jgi:hypothetical protein